MKRLIELKNTVEELPRGGYIVDTPSGYVQFGSPPETIKDTMFLPKGVPQIFVLPSVFFSWTKGISVAELEFPIYYNFFIKKRLSYIVCDREQFERFKIVLQEAVFGPEILDLKKDYYLDGQEKHIPHLKNEMEYFSKGFKLKNMVKFGIFENNSFSINGITISKAAKEDFSVSFKGKMIGKVPKIISYKPAYEIGSRLAEPYKPPLFGVTCLGPSHGFDPEENTSGFILWLNHNGIMIDPPVNSTEWLVDSNVNPKVIDSIILTHCHADHDAGTFQKILEEGRVTVYSTVTIMESFLRKYSAFSGVSASYLKKLFYFVPIKIGKPVFINSGKFEMFYTLHSIPTIGFKMQFQDKSFVYSSDHNNDPEVHQKLLDQNVISWERYEELRNFPWENNVIYHESGIAPLHTPIQFLNSLPKEIQKKTVVYHINKNDFPSKDDTDLKLAKFGIQDTLYFEVMVPEHEKASEILSILKHIDFFSYLPISKALEFVNIVKEEKYKKGETIIKKGTKGNKFFIIQSGNVSVDSGGLEVRKIYGTYDYFGEVAIMTNQKRSADVIAETDVMAYTIEKEKFLDFIAGTQIEAILSRLINVRTSETWNILSTSNSFQCLTSTQKTWLESLLNPIEIKSSGKIISEGLVLNNLYIIREGKVDVSKNQKYLATLTRGSFVGEIQKIYDDKPAEYTFANKQSVSLYSIRKEDIKNFLELNPGLIMKIRYDFNN